jgi:hypothetical protein
LSLISCPEHHPQSPATLSHHYLPILTHPELSEEVDVIFLVRTQSELAFSKHLASKPGVELISERVDTAYHYDYLGPDVLH